MSQIKVLVVDDDKDIRDLTKKILVKEDFEIIEAIDGLDGLDKFSKNRPDLVILDIMMPKIDGLEMLKKIKEIEPDSTAIIFTAYANMERAIKAMRYGAKDFIVKPFKLEEFIAVINRYKETIELKKELKKSEEKYHFLFENASDSIFVHDFDGHLIDVNENAAKRLGYKKSELLKMNFKKLEAPEFMKLTSFEDTLKEDGWTTYETVHIRKDRSEMPVEITATIIHYNGQEVIQSFARDITQRKKLEKQLKQAHEDLKKRHDELQQEYAQLKTKVDEFQFIAPSEKIKIELEEEEKEIIDKLGNSALIKYTTKEELINSVKKIMDIFYKNGNRIIFITSQPRAFQRYEEVSKCLKEGAIQIVDMPSGWAVGMQPSSYITIPMSHLFLFGDLIRKIPPNSVLIFEPLSQLILARGFETAYQFLGNYSEELVNRGITFVALLKSSAHSPEEVGGIENILLNTVTVSNGDLI